MDKKKLYKRTVSLAVILGIIIVFSAYWVNISIILRAYNEVDGIVGVVWIIIIRIFILSVSAAYIFSVWLKKEALYLSDLPFLFGIFFLLLVFGKSIDLLFDLTYYYYTEEDILALLKVRFIIIIFNVAPMIYLSIGMILYALSLKEKHTKYRDEKRRNKDTFILIVVISIIEIIAVILTPNIPILAMLLPLIVIPSLITIVWLFAFAYKNKRLSQVNPLILAFGFGAYLVSQITRPLLQNLLASAALYIILSEIIDLFIFIIIFIGFYLKMDYAKD